MLSFAFVHTLIKSKRHRDHPMDLWVFSFDLQTKKKDNTESIKLTHLHIASFNLFSPMLRKEIILEPCTIDIGKSLAKFVSEQLLENLESITN